MNKLLTIAGFLLCVFFILMFVPKHKNVIQTDRTSIIIDSMRSVSVLEKIEISKALQASEEAITKALQKKIVTKKIYITKLEERYVPDTTLCDTLLTEYKEQVALLDQEAESYSRQVYECDKQNILKDTVILNYQNTQNILKKEIITLQKSNKRNWIERNRGWVAFIGGCGAIYFVTK